MLSPVEVIQSNASAGQVTLTDIGEGLVGTISSYELFKVVSRRVALLDVFFILVATAIEAAGLVSQFTPLVLRGNGHYTSALPAAQLHALAYLPLDLSGIDYSVHTVFFGFDILLMAYLVYRSASLPTAIAIRTPEQPSRQS